MFGDIGVPELLIILAIVILLFGVGRVSRLGKDLGTAVKDFRKAVTDDEQTKATVVQSAPQAAPPVQVPPAQHQAAQPPRAAAYQETPPAQGGDQKPPSIF